MPRLPPEPPGAIAPPSPPSFRLCLQAYISMVVEEELKTMEAQQGAAATMPPSKDLSQVVKRKRTKRKRPHYSSSDGGEYCPSNARENLVNSTTTTTEEDISPAATPTPTTSTTNDDEVDTAKCLLLLSQGHCHKRKQDDDFGTPYKYKFSSKIYLETPTENGKAGIYVYECKTCNRKFPSFQALGGHRASHRKPKAAAIEERKKLVYSDDENMQQPPPIKRSFSTSSLSVHNNNSKSSPKVHECGICGAEFMSGQALGGHMRRHRGAPPPSATNTTLCLGTFSSTPVLGMDQIQKDSKKSKGNIVNLSLDLNLPATPEDENNQTHHNFSFPQQQSPLVLSTAPTLVDCHY